MSKFCGNCGTQLEDDAVVCSNCGCNLAPANNGTPAAAGATPGENAVAFAKEKTGAFIGKLKSDKKFLGIVLGAVAAVIVLIVVLVLVFGGGYKKAIDNYIDAMYYGDYSAYKATMPKEVLEDLDISKDDFKEEFESIKDELEEEYGKDYDVSYDIIEEEKYNEDDLDDLRDRLKNYYGISKRSVTAAYDVEIELTIDGSEDEDTKELDFTIVKIDGDWYIY